MGTKLTRSQEGRDLAKRFNAQCIETSAKQRVNVDEAFIAVVRAIRRFQKVSTRVGADAQEMSRASIIEKACRTAEVLLMRLSRSGSYSGMAGSEARCRPNFEPGVCDGCRPCGASRLERSKDRIRVRAGSAPHQEHGMPEEPAMPV